jgi:hypothetical protein
MSTIFSDERALGKALIAAFANAGHIDLTQSKEDVWTQLRSFVKSLPDDFDVVIDHTPKLLQQARTARLEKSYEFAVLMYATWVEHSLNLVLQELALARGISGTYQQLMLREASLRAKTTWLLPLLGAAAR